jgi:hypothetical protein
VPTASGVLARCEWSFGAALHEWRVPQSGPVISKRNVLTIFHTSSLKMAPKTPNASYLGAAVEQDLLSGRGGRREGGTGRDLAESTVIPCLSYNSSYKPLHNKRIIDAAEERNLLQAALLHSE